MTTTSLIDLTLEIHSSDGTIAEYYQSAEEPIRQALAILDDPQLFARRHLLLSSRSSACMVPCSGIDLLRIRTPAPLSLKFPLNLPVGQFDLTERPEGPSGIHQAAPERRFERQPGQAHRHTTWLEICMVGGWTVHLEVEALIRGPVQDERHLFSHLPDVPTIPFRLPGGGVGLINTANITAATASPKPDVLSGNPLQLTLRRKTAPPRRAAETPPSR